MKSWLGRRQLLRGLAFAAAAILLVLAAWVLVAGPVTVARVIRFGDSQIDDFRHDPGRELAPAAEPWALHQSRLALPQDIALPGGGESLEAWLADHDTIAFLLLADDRLVSEHYFQGHSASSISQLFSVTKSVTSALVGAAIQDGLISSVEQPITDYVPELSERSFDRVTLHHLLTMTSGSAYRENDNPFGEHVILNYTPRLEGRILEFEMESDPGSEYRYKSGDNALLGLALARSLGAETISEYAQRRLWQPAGMEHAAEWTLDRAQDGLERTWCCLAASARDLARFGLLYANRGEGPRGQVLPAEWVARSTAPQVSAELWPEEYERAGWDGYGYQWWLASAEAGDYFALGKDGQYLYVNSMERVVIVRLGWSQGGLTSSQWLQVFREVSGALAPVQDTAG